jgi:DNA-binding Lrp family transcriptional regulator
VATRLRRLEADQIMRVVALTDMEAFGHRYLTIAKIRVRGRSPGDVGAELAALPETISVNVSTGRFDLMVAILSKDRDHLSRTIGEVVPALEGVDEIRSEFALAVLRWESQWAILDAADEPAEPWSAGEAVDELDQSIIRLLQKDGRSSNRRIAAELDVSEGTVRARIRRLEDEGMIRIQAVSDPLAFGQAANAYVGVQVDRGRVGAVAKALLANDSVHLLIRCLGEFEFMAVVGSDTREALSDIVLDEISTISDVRRTETFDIWRVMKFSYRWARLV